MQGIFKKLCVILFILLLPCSSYSQQAPPYIITEEDLDPYITFPVPIKFANGTVTQNADGSASIAGGSGDAVTVNGTGADTTANFLDGDFEWTLTDGGAGGPDDITGTLADPFIKSNIKMYFAQGDLYTVGSNNTSVCRGYFLKPGDGSNDFKMGFVAGSSDERVDVGWNEPDAPGGYIAFYSQDHATSPSNLELVYGTNQAAEGNFAIYHHYNDGTEKWQERFKIDTTGDITLTPTTDVILANNPSSIRTDADNSYVGIYGGSSYQGGSYIALYGKTDGTNPEDAAVIIGDNATSEFKILSFDWNSTWTQIFSVQGNNGNVTTIGNIKGATYGSDASVSDTELLYINTLSSNAQTQIDGKEDTLTDKASLESTISDVSDFAEADGDVYTGVHDFGGATSLEVPNGAAPTVDAVGEIALDTDAISQGMLVTYLASSKAYLVATTDTPADNESPKFDLATGTVSWEADAGGGSTTSYQETLTIDSDGDTSLTLSNSPVSAASVILYVNGQQQEQGAGKDYTISGTAITWLDRNFTLKTTDLAIAHYNSATGTMSQTDIDTEAELESVVTDTSDIYTNNDTYVGEIYLPAAAATIPTSAYAEKQVFTGTNHTYTVLAFDQNADEKCFWNFAVPSKYTGSTMTITPYWTADAGTATRGVSWKFDTGCFANDEAFKSGALGGTEIEVEDAMIATGDLHNATSAAMTNDFTASQFAVLYCYRDVDAYSGTNLDADALLLGVLLTFSKSGLAE